MDQKVWIDGIGWLGSVCVVAAYFSVSYDRFRMSPFLYQLLNAAGSLCLIVNTAYYRAYPSASVNIIWLGIALMALLRNRVKTKVKS
ncbi:hypothetical protein Q0590_07025 [Rhodocytophaga aerolata]|uniref:CBU-0592-like domain-containing protein n=1 Tax=Rhodocytophaga aerolata TaxID=455078 RepID=A0ABT8R1M7_9BACT|nr:hypothetical protein [Rhodocytophaga aerolata]MDO1445998.1 hypothetical protein [Rhodocytophaga aerolata]